MHDMNSSFFDDGDEPITVIDFAEQEANAEQKTVPELEVAGEQETSTEHIHLTTASEWDAQGETHYSKNEYEQACKCYQTALELDPQHINSLYSLGWLHEFGQGVKKNTGTALKYYYQAAALGHPQATKQWVLLANPGLTTAKEWNTKGDDYYDHANHLAALYCYQEALKYDSNNNYTLYSLGWLYQYGLGVEKDTDKALEYYSQSAAHGHPQATKQWVLLANPGLTTAKEWSTKGDDYYKHENYLAAFYCYQEALQHDFNNKYILYSLGWLYQHGQGVEKDTDKALKYHSQSAALGYPDAEKQQFILQNSHLTNAKQWCIEGVKYHDGNNDYLQDYKKARFCFEQATNFDPPSIPAFCNLGVIYGNGNGVTENIATACEYYHRAIKLENKSAITELCNLILSNNDIENAKKYFDIIVKDKSLELGNLLQKAGELELAMVAFEKFPSPLQAVFGAKPPYLKMINLYQKLTQKQEYTKEELSNKNQHPELACYFLGKFYQNIKRDFKKAKFYYLKFFSNRNISNEKIADLYYQMGTIYESETDIANEIKYYVAASFRGHAQAYDKLCGIVKTLADKTAKANLFYKIAELGKKHLEIDPPPLADAKEPITAESVKNSYLCAARAGHPDAQYALSLLLTEEKVEHETDWRQAAIDTWLKLAEKETTVTHKKDQSVSTKSTAYTNAISYLQKAINANSEAAKTKLRLLTNQLITTLLYQALQEHKNSKWDLTAKSCVPYLVLLKKINPKYSTWTVEQFKEYIASEEKTHHTYFSEEVSDNSDEEEEKSFQKLSAPVKQATYTYSRGLFNKANLPEAKKILHGIVQQEKRFERNKPVLKPTEKIGKVPNPNETAMADLAELNHWRRQGKLAEGLKRTQRTKFVIAQYRGITYKITDWKTDERRGHRNMSEVKAPLFSASVYKEAKYPYTTDCLNDTDAKAMLLQHAKDLKERLLVLRKTGPHFKKAKSKKGNHTYQYDSTYDRLQDEYTKNYDKFGIILAEGKISCEKKGEVELNLLNAFNPFVSTGDMLLHALKYAYGIKPYKGHEHERILPRWRKDENGEVGQTERPYAGKLYMTLHSVEEYAKDAPIHIVSHNHLGKLSVNDNAKGFQIINERETTFPAYIPEGRVFYTHTAKYPSFNGPYKASYASKYGLDEEFFNLFQQALRDFSPGSDELETARILLGEYLCHYHQFRLLEVTQEEAAKRGAVLVYIDERGDLGLNLPNLVSSASKKDTQGKDNLNDIRNKRRQPIPNESTSDSNSDEEKEVTKKPRQ